MKKVVALRTRQLRTYFGTESSRACTIKKEIYDCRVFSTCRYFLSSRSFDVAAFLQTVRKSNVLRI